MLRGTVCKPSHSDSHYRGFRLIDFGGLVYGIPADLVTLDFANEAFILRHPAVLRAPTRAAVQALVDEFDQTTYHTESLEQVNGYQLVHYRQQVYGIPQALMPLDLNVEENRRLADVIRGSNIEEVRERIQTTEQAIPVEFAGWLPVFKMASDCGTHPQFGHAQSPPPGYKFIRSCSVTPTRCSAIWQRLQQFMQWVFLPLALGWQLVNAICRNLIRFGPIACGLILFAILRIFSRMLRRGGRLKPTLRFLRTRHYQSQLLLPRQSGLVFLTSVPYTYSQSPWLIEIEDTTTLFHPFIRNGETSNLKITESPYYPLVQTLLDSPNCRGIVTHMRSTADALPLLFPQANFRDKISYVPLGVKLPSQWRDQGDDGTIHLLFTNSWHQSSQGFFLRGGLDVLKAFHILHVRYPQLRLTVRANLPHMDERYFQIIEDCGVRVISRFLSSEQLNALQRRTHIYLLPAARIHIVSVLQAMSYGQAVVASDGWGMEEYLTQGETGLIIPGRGGIVSWMDERAGLLREDYSTMYKSNPLVVDGLVESVSRLVEERDLRRSLGRAARTAVGERFNLEQWNRGLKVALDKAHAA